MYQKTRWCFSFLQSSALYSVQSSLQSSAQYSVQSSAQYSIQFSAHPGTSGHFCTQLDTCRAQLDTSGTQLEHSWSTFGMWPWSTAGTQLEHIWCAVQVHSWSTARTSGTHVAYSPSALLDTFGANLGTAGHI